MTQTSRRDRGRLVLLVSTSTLVAGVTPRANAYTRPSRTERVSVSTAGAEGNQGFDITNRSH